MRISVIVPVRNEEESIRALLDGLLTQTRRADEIIITDGGSTDMTARIIEEYITRGAPIHLIREEVALPGRGRNLAAAHASSEWLAFTDAGIRPASNWLAALAARIEQEQAADVVYGGWEIPYSLCSPGSGSLEHSTHSVAHLQTLRFIFTPQPSGRLVETMAGKHFQVLRSNSDPCFTRARP